MDVATGLSYYGYRYYDSESGRCLTLDLVQTDYLNPQSLNRYTYALDNPIRFADSDGLMFYDVNENGERVAGGIEAVERTLSDVPGRGESRDQFSIEITHQIATQFGSVTTTTSSMSTVPTSWVNTSAQTTVTTLGSQATTINTSTPTTSTIGPPPMLQPAHTIVVTVSTQGTTYTGIVICRKSTTYVLEGLAMVGLSMGAEPFFSHGLWEIGVGIVERLFDPNDPERCS